MRNLADDALNFSPFAVSAMLDCWACAGESAEAYGLQQRSRKAYNRILVMADLARGIFGLMETAQRDKDIATTSLSMGVPLNPDWFDELTPICTLSGRDRPRGGRTRVMTG